MRHREPSLRRVVKRSVGAWVALTSLGIGVFVLAPAARAAVQYDVINMTVNAGAIHVLGNSNQFTNFRTGAIDNYYAYAHAHLDGSPFSEGRSSPLDSGPLVATIASGNQFCPIEPPPPPPPPLPPLPPQFQQPPLNGCIPQSSGFHQPQYSDVRFPPGGKPIGFGCPPGSATCTSNGGPYAESYARLNYAFAQAIELGQPSEAPKTSQTPVPEPTPSGGGLPPPPGGSQSGSTPTAPATAPSAKLLPVSYQPRSYPLTYSFQLFNAGMRAWRARYMTADDQRRYPMAEADPSTPDVVQGLSSVTETIYDQASGTLTARGETRVARFSIGGDGGIVLYGVRTLVKLVDDGTEPTSKISIQIANATVGGVPVTIGPDGVSVKDMQIKALDLAQPASQALNILLQQAGWTITSAGPTETTSTGEKTVDATGAVHLKFEQPSPPDSVSSTIGLVPNQCVQSPVPQCVGGPGVNGLLEGIPRFSADIYLGQVFADQLGTPSIALTGGGAAGGFGTPGTPGSSQFIPGTQGSPGTLGTPGSSSGGPGGLAGLIKTKPLYLLLLYFLWQTIIIGTGASLWWLRMGGKPA